MVVIEIAIILGLSLFFLEESAPILPTIALILLIAASVFTFLGMIIGYIFTSEETGVLASISLGSVLLFVSGVILPLEGISIALRNITFFNPFVVTEKLIHETFLFKTPLGDVWVDLMILVAYAVVLFLIVLILESLLHKHLIHRFMKHKHPHLRQQEKKNKNYL
jgi:ABC-2 type transport system permease protein